MLNAVSRPLAGSSAFLRAAALSFAGPAAASTLPAAVPRLFYSSDSRAFASESEELGPADRSGSGNGNPNDTPLTRDDSGNSGATEANSSSSSSSADVTTTVEADEGQACIITGALNETPCHELATGGLYESFRKDREAVPNPFPGTTIEAFPDSHHWAPLPPGSYPVHSDPSTANQHPDQAFRTPAQYFWGPSPHSVNLILPDETLALQAQQMKEAEGGQEEEGQGLGEGPSVREAERSSGSPWAS